MANPAIYTLIKNNTATSRVLKWKTNVPLYLPGNGSIEVDYDVWSVANKAQRESIMSLTRNKIVELHLNVLTAPDTYSEYVFMPHLSQYTPTVVPVTVTPREATSDFSTDITDTSANIKIASGNMSDVAEHFGIKAEEVTQHDNSDTIQVESAGTEGFSVVEDAAADMMVSVEPEEVAGIAVEDVAVDEAAVDVAPADIPPVEETAETVEIKTAFTAMVENKEWDAALQLLIDTFGAEQVTFTKRTIMSMKDYDSIVDKYSLVQR